jgi:putative SOS response-associated peptidase YedK
MCGRIVRSSPAEVLRAEFGAEPPPDLAARYNVCPGEPILAVVAGRDGLRMGWLRWGLVPPFATDPRAGARAINARAESVSTRAAFRHAFRTHRCLVVADGFYEWRRDGREKQPFFVRLRSGRPLAFAGLWERWRPPDGTGPPLVTGAIVTCAANGVVRPIHDRMPVILDAAARDAWLDPACADPARVLVPCADALLEAWPVSARVNRPQHDDPELIARAG